jgi:molybdopterin-guanine dinucleotide biosynthesis protein A
MNISAVLLAGGESRRMGQDKATLLFHDKPLWQIQLDLLRKFQPQEIFISARTDPPWRPNDVEFIADETLERGPLSGLTATLPRISTGHLLALAIDMPFMTDGYLQCLRERVKAGCGVLPMIDGRAEPMAAIYPASAHVDFVAALSGPEFSLQTITKKLIASGKLLPVSVAKAEEKFFRNLNEPSLVARHSPASDSRG